MVDSVVLIKTKRACRQVDDDWEYYLKLKVYDFEKRSVERYYLKDVSTNRLCFFKVQYVAEWKGVVMVYLVNGELQVYQYTFERRLLQLLVRIPAKIPINLDDIDSHCFLSKDGLLCFGNNIRYFDFSTSAYIPLGKYGSLTACQNTFPVSLIGACVRKGDDGQGVYMVYEGRVRYTVFGVDLPLYSFLYPMDAERIIRIGGREYPSASPTHYYRSRYPHPSSTLDILDLSTQTLTTTYQMPQAGIVTSALSTPTNIYFLWDVYSYALKLNVSNMSIRMLFMADYFMECTKVVYLHSKGKLRLPIGLVREICAFVAENKKIAEYLSELVL